MKYVFLGGSGMCLIMIFRQQKMYSTLYVMYVVGPLNDTILKQLHTRSMVDMGIKNILSCVDMQLYVVTKQVCWNQHIIRQLFNSTREKQATDLSIFIYKAFTLRNVTLY